MSLKNIDLRSLLNSFAALISNHMTNKVWDVIAPLKFRNGYVIFPYFILDVVAHLCCYYLEILSPESCCTSAAQFTCLHICIFKLKDTIRASSIALNTFAKNIIHGDKIVYLNKRTKIFISTKIVLSSHILCVSNKCKQCRKWIIGIRYYQYFTDTAFTLFGQKWKKRSRLVSRIICSQKINEYLLFTVLCAVVLDIYDSIHRFRYTVDDPTWYIFGATDSIR